MRRGVESLPTLGIEQQDRVAERRLPERSNARP